ILPVSGALGDSDWIDNGDTTPACMFHGDADATVTIDSAMFVLFGLINVTSIEGSNYIADRMDAVGIDHCYHVTPGGGHVPYLGDAGEYDYTLSLMSGFMQGLICNETLDCEYHVINDVSNSTLELASTNKLTIYPNPANDVFFLKGVYNQTCTKLYTLDGRKVTDILGSQFNASTLPEGIYVVETMGSNGSQMRERIVIAH
ncbi:MAG: T9SS type A sorting domain-containing protein, partial [Flavobacteriales bacterium]